MYVCTHPAVIERPVTRRPTKRNTDRSATPPIEVPSLRIPRSFVLPPTGLRYPDWTCSQSPLLDDSPNRLRLQSTEGKSHSTRRAVTLAPETVPRSNVFREKPLPQYKAFFSRRGLTKRSLAGLTEVRLQQRENAADLGCALLSISGLSPLWWHTIAVTGLHVDGGQVDCSFAVVGFRSAAGFLQIPTLRLGGRPTQPQRPRSFCVVGS